MTPDARIGGSGRPAFVRVVLRFRHASADVHVPRLTLVVFTRPNAVPCRSGGKGGHDKALKWLLHYTTTPQRNPCEMLTRARSPLDRGDLKWVDEPLQLRQRQKLSVYVPI